MGKRRREILNDLVEGVEAMSSHRQGKATLKTHEVSVAPAPTVDARFVRETREKLAMSQQVFARTLRINPRTLERWEQGRSRPNDQAAVLLMLVHRFPETVKRIEALAGMGNPE